MSISRRQLIIVAALAVCAALYFGWKNRSWSYANLPPTATGPWVAFGDSLTEGFGAPPGGDYPSQLSARLGVPIRNMGASGETSSHGVNRLPTVDALNPRVVLLCFGGNDTLQNQPRATMIANVRTMVERLQAGGSFVVLIGVRGASLVGDRNASAFRDLAREKKTLYVPDILDEVFNTPTLMSDYVHPNEAGYGRIAERIENALQPVLGQLR